MIIVHGVFSNNFGCNVIMNGVNVLYCVRMLGLQDDSYSKVSINESTEVPNAWLCIVLQSTQFLTCYCEDAQGQSAVVEELKL